MAEFPNKLRLKTLKRQQENAFRSLQNTSQLIDFSTNDYLGFAKNEAIFDKAHQYLVDNNLKQNGATGSRLLTGNHQIYKPVEALLCNYYDSEASLIFNSGYDANIGFFSAVPQRNDVILYDEFVHASIRDGIKLSDAKAFKFKHNDLNDLDAMLNRVQRVKDQIYVVTESVFSMDGNSPALDQLIRKCKQNNALLIVDEAHAVGVFGEHGQGLLHQLNLHNEVFARLITFGKALGCHGAAILVSEELKNYLINFVRSFIYTTALPPHSVATILESHKFLLNSNPIPALKKNISHFKNELKRLNIAIHFITSDSAIQSCIINGNNQVKAIAHELQKSGFDVWPILAPSVPKGKERLRFCIHSFNTSEEITHVLNRLATFVE